MSIRVRKSGLLTTIQDFGRYGYQKYGVVVGGVVDPYAARIANLLVGNEGTESVLEITVQGPTLFFEKDALIAICGGDMSPAIERTPVPQWRPIFVKAGYTLSIQAAKTGCRAYLAIAGGFDVPQVLGSTSTFLRGGFGGMQGRAVLAGDILTAREPSRLSRILFTRLSELASYRQMAGEEVQDQLYQSCNGFVLAKWVVSYDLYSYIPDSSGKTKVTVRVIHGPEYPMFDSDSQLNLYNCTYQVTTKSDRMGCRLSGQRLTLTNSFEMISEAVTVGTVQVPPDGNPIILLADRQTTGGYPRIGHVASVDIPIVGQCMPGICIEFCAVPVADAQNLYMEKLDELAKLAYSIRTNIQSGK